MYLRYCGPAGSETAAASASAPAASRRFNTTDRFSTTASGVSAWTDALDVQDGWSWTTVRGAAGPASAGRAVAIVRTGTNTNPRTARRTEDFMRTPMAELEQHDGGECARMAGDRPSAGMLFTHSPAYGRIIEVFLSHTKENFISPLWAASIFYRHSAEISAAMKRQRP